ncbi:MAG: fructose-1,6-bisphosphatase [Firmicutes bacterium]|nr:fructose-1,6-bisphosphatase [Bacillota bacterium]
MEIKDTDIKYLRLLAKDFPTAQAAQAEIINLNSILNLPKGTEHFFSDIHGESEAFEHILRNASGTIKLRIDELFPELTAPERRSLATLVYYPEEKLEILKAKTEDLEGFYRSTLYKLLKLLERVSFKYSRSYVRKRFTKEYAYILDEFLYGAGDMALERADHKKHIIDSIIEVGAADNFIVDMCHLISKLSVFKLHILGDIFDRGPGGDVCMDMLRDYGNVDIQWGNHDILWMGAAAGNLACIANVIRICTRYDNLHTLEVGYGISLRPLLTFAAKVYGSDPCTDFKANSSIADAMTETDLENLRRVGKAISVIQFKLEAQLTKAHPYYEMDGSRLLDSIDFNDWTVDCYGKRYPLNNRFFPTVDPKNPDKLTKEEAAVMKRLQQAFLESKPLQEDIRFLFDKGSLYKKVNGNLLYHGCIPLSEDGEFDLINTKDGPKKGREWFDYVDALVRKGYFGDPDDPDKQRGIDICWYLWCGYKSPLFGKAKMTTFERLFIDDESTWVEDKNPYYKLMDDVKIIEKILKEFDCNVEEGVIVNGHMPVKKGKNPMHAGGRAIVIDGGFAKAYQKTTGIAGYTLVQNSWGFVLTAHEPFESREKAIAQELDIHSTQVAKEDIRKRILNKDTDDGQVLKDQIEGLKVLLEAYRRGIISEAN